VIVIEPLLTRTPLTVTTPEFVYEIDGAPPSVDVEAPKVHALTVQAPVVVVVQLDVDPPLGSAGGRR
jgi:hypothetical protein